MKQNNIEFINAPQFDSKELPLKLMGQYKYKEKDKSLLHQKLSSRELIVKWFIDKYYNPDGISLHDFKTITSFISYGYKDLKFGNDINENIETINKLLINISIEYSFQYNESKIMICKKIK